MRSDMTRHMSDDLLDEIEQRAMAERILLNISARDACLSGSDGSQ